MPLWSPKLHLRTMSKMQLPGGSSVKNWCNRWNTALRSSKWIFSCKFLTPPCRRTLSEASDIEKRKSKSPYVHTYTPPPLIRVYYLRKWERETTSALTIEPGSYAKRCSSLRMTMLRSEDRGVTFSLTHSHLLTHPTHWMTVSMIESQKVVCSTPIYQAQFQKHILKFSIWSVQREYGATSWMKE